MEYKMRTKLLMSQNEYIDICTFDHLNLRSTFLFSIFGWCFDIVHSDNLNVRGYQFEMRHNYNNHYFIRSVVKKGTRLIKTGESPVQ